MYQNKKECPSEMEKGNILRNLSVISQKNDLKMWKDSESYGHRWIVETVFSCIKKNVWRVCLFG